MDTARGAVPGGAGPKSETVVLNEPGSLFWDRWNQLDINFKKNIRHNNNVLTLQVDVFNVLNSNAIRGINNTVGSGLGQATTIMVGRFPRLAVNYKFYRLRLASNGPRLRRVSLEREARKRTRRHEDTKTRRHEDATGAGGSNHLPHFLHPRSTQGHRTQRLRR